MKAWQFFLLASFIYGAAAVSKWAAVFFQILFLVLGCAAWWYIDREEK